MAATPLAGALVDTVRAKRALIVVATAVTALASLAMRFVHGYPAVAASQVVAAVSGAVLAPAAAGVTLGIVRRQGFDRQFGRNQMANHAGNVAGAALAGWLGWHVGFDAVFALVGVFTVLAIVSTLAIPGTRSITRPHGVSILQVPHRERMLRIHHASDAASASASESESESESESASAPPSRVGGLRTLADNRPLVLLGASLALFHLGNAAMLPLYGMGVVVTHRSNASAFTAQTIVIAQCVMIAAAWLAPRLIRAHGYWRVLLFSYLVLPVRGLVAAAWLSEAGGRCRCSTASAPACKAWSCPRSSFTCCMAPAA